MMKVSFYSLHNIDGKLTAVLHRGWTCGKFCYYLANPRTRIWCAIDPMTGLSVCNATRMRDCFRLTRKPEIADKFRQIQTSAAYLRWVEDFSKAKAELAA